MFRLLDQAGAWISGVSPPTPEQTRVDTLERWLREFDFENVLGDFVSDFDRGEAAAGYYALRRSREWSAQDWLMRSMRDNFRDSLGYDTPFETEWDAVCAAIALDAAALERAFETQLEVLRECAAATGIRGAHAMERWNLLGGLLRRRFIAQARQLGEFPHMRGLLDPIDVLTGALAVPRPDSDDDELSIPTRGVVGRPRRPTSDADTLGDCAVCFEPVHDRVVLNCGHTFCTACTGNLDTCPLCREKISQRIRLVL